MTQLVNKWEYIHNADEEIEKVENDELPIEDYPLSIWGELRVGSIPVGSESGKYKRQNSTKYTSALALSANGLPPQVTLADGFPLLLTSNASLKVLQDKINKNTKGGGKPIEIPMNRFRANVVIDALPNVAGFAEDQWREITIGKPMRCDMKGVCSGGAKNAVSFSLLKGCKFEAQRKLDYNL
jgi:hypothetical protein